MQWWQVNYTVLFCFSTVFFLFLSLFTVKNLFIHTFFVFSKFSYFDVVLGKKTLIKTWQTFEAWQKECLENYIFFLELFVTGVFFFVRKTQQVFVFSNVKNKTDFDIKSCLPFLFLCFFVVVVLAVRNDTSAKPFYKSKHWRSKQNKKRKSPFVLSCSKMVHPFCLCFVLKTWKRNDAKKRKEKHAQSSTKGSKKKAENTCLPQKNSLFDRQTFCSGNNRKKNCFDLPWKKSFLCIRLFFLCWRWKKAFSFPNL